MDDTSSSPANRLTIMKTHSTIKTTLCFLLCTLILNAVLEATTGSARYVRFDGYSSTDNGQINIYEIEIYAGGSNIAPTASITANSASNNTNALVDGSLSYPRFSTNRNNPGQPSESSPHRIEFDLHSVKSLDEIVIYPQGNWTIGFELFISEDGINWTGVGRYSTNSTVTSYLTVPHPQVLSAAMRDGTTIMDITFRVDDLDDATVKVRALAFVDGVRSFANVLRPSSFVEGTGANLGDTIQSNTDLSLAWDVGADWDIDLGQVKFEILAMDGRGLLAFDWVTIPAAGGEPELTISKDSPTNSAVLDALFWQYADGDTGLVLSDGALRGDSLSGIFERVDLAQNESVSDYGYSYVLKLMNVDFAEASDLNYADTARAGIQHTGVLHPVNRAYNGSVMIVGWGSNRLNQISMPVRGVREVTAIDAGYGYSLALQNGGTVVGWGVSSAATIPDELTEVIAIAAGNSHSMALKNDGTVVCWGSDSYGQTTIPVGLSSVTAIAAGRYHSLAVKSDGTVVSWGRNYYGQNNIPVGLSGVTAIAAGYGHSLALKSDGTVIGWGNNVLGQISIPAGLSGVTAIAAAGYHSLALKSDGTVVSWGSNAANPPVGLANVTAIATSGQHGLALKNDGTVVGWGANWDGQTSIPAGLSGVTAIAAGDVHSLALEAAAP
jgi:hypothetical protein